MSVHSHSAAHYPAASAGSMSDPAAAMTATPTSLPGLDPTSAPAYARHVVTAVLVTHDGARWLPDALAGLLGQERPVQNAVAADTGSADDSARLVADAFGDDRVLHLARRTGFGAAVDEAVRAAGVPTPDDLPYLKRPGGWDPVTRQWHDENYDLPELPYGEPEQWLWLLHDDCAPAPGALAELLRAVEAEREAGGDVAVVGPKLRGWYDRRQLLEVGVTIAHSGRRWTGLDRREQDQGQHDHVRPVLSVSTAGMLIRRDVYEELGGFDRALPLMRDDVDLCWRAQAAGHRVLVAPEAVLRHAEAASRERRTVDCAGRGTTSPHRVDKAGAVHTLLVNSRGAVLPWVLLRLVVGTVARTLAYLVGKAPGQAVDEISGLLGTLLRPGRVLGARRRRGKGTVEPAELRPLFPPPGATVRATVEQVAGSLAGGSDTDAPGAGRHGGAVESGPGGDDADFLEVEQFARLKRLARRPGPVLFAVLLLASLAACRALLGGGALAGGALLPVPDQLGDLWGRYADGWHAVGTGTTEPAPPYLALLATLAALLLGSTHTAVTVVLVASVPLAGCAAYLASGSLVPSRLLRAWGSVVYAFLPAVTGALAGGHLGTAVLAVLLPVMARAALSAAGLLGHPGTWRATWAYTLLLTLATAFTPMVWPLAVLLGVGVLVLRRGALGAYAPRFVAQSATPLLVLAPWSLTLLPFGFFRTAGLDTAAGGAGPLDLLGASPGGPGTLSALLFLGVLAAALAALLREERRRAILTAWAVALAALLFAALANSSTWAGPATLVQGAALLGAALVGADGARHRVAEQSFGWRQPLAALIALACALGPAAAALTWMAAGADGPLERRDPVQVPAFVAEESRTQDQARTLVLAGDSAAEVDYALVRGSGGRLGDAELAAAAGTDDRLSAVVARLVAGSGADQADQLGGFAVRYVLVRDGSPREMSRVLDSTPGLTRLSQQDGSALWRVDRQVSRAAVVAKDGSGEPLPVAAGPVELHTEIPAGPAGRVLRLADTADEGWRATLDGEPLERVTVDDWAQGFTLPEGGGRLDITFEAPFTHTAWLWTQGFLGLVLVVLALPGRRRVVDDDLPDEPAPVPAQPVEGEGRRARRLRAQAEAEAEATAQDPEPEAELPAQRDAAPAEPEPAWTAPEPPEPQQGGYDPYGYQNQGYDQSPQGYPAQPGYDPNAYDPYQQQAQPQDPYQQGGWQQGQQGYPGYEQQPQQGYGHDPAAPEYGQYEQPPHGPGRERPDGSQQ
ncbi:glycosyltransferase [Streptomyces sp. BBFR102]|uniref:glycosyltransferase family 2 protein n=1 Tax=Streptomyces sp. BBFR102 TaxID=3448171 RepID=UPI003F52CBCD